MSVNTKVNGQLVKSAGLYKASVPIQSGDIYSEQERQVGVWSDGKPLYQINLTWTGSISLRTDAYTTIPFTNIPQNIDFVVAKEVITDQLYDTRVRFYYNNGDIQAVTNQTGGQTVTSIILPILYTKTTDMAGSGEYVPSGDKAVHYSTDEEVIGTWIDGSTIYRKVLTGLSLATAWQSTYYPKVDTASLINNVKEVINARALTGYTSNASRNSIASVIVNNSNSTWTIATFDDITINTLILEYTKTS